MEVDKTISDLTEKENIKYYKCEKDCKGKVQIDMCLSVWDTAQASSIPRMYR